ncbi:unnamed protein product [Angiostrongylus costaricensis]|uniref:Secreted protein n=1 Tax=Angiostrongylus costaricensis TaxID=334426 RepID=A0A0R3Q0A1_ANGCS|nr:unnamed protein product [Angiostrongylus costaricensis]
MKFVLLLAFVSIALSRPWCIDDYDEYNNIVIDGDVYFASDKKLDIFGSCEDDSSSSADDDNSNDDYGYPDPDTSDEKTTAKTDDLEYHSNENMYN